jgi:predicted O-methyltransferase YrrM
VPCRYSTIWLAQALPADGSLLTCEYSEKHAVVARANLADAGFKEPQVEVRVGPALDTLRALHADMPFDLMFVDADKTSNTEYVKEGKRLVRSGGVIVSAFSVSPTMG